MNKILKVLKEPMYLMYEGSSEKQVKISTSDELETFCTKEGLSPTAVQRVWRENIKSHKGWTRILSKADVEAIRACGNNYTVEG